MKWLRLLFFFSFLSLILSGCGGCGDDVAGPGEACDSELSEPCEEGEFDLECITDDDGTDRCLQPAGTRCDQDRDSDICAPGAECIEADDGESRCLLTDSATCDPDDDFCGPGLVCEEVEDEEDGHRCHAPIAIQGMVFDAQNEDPIEGAHVIAFDEERSALSDVAVTDENGEYEMRIPAVRGEDGGPVQQMVTLRASAQDYQTFPGGLRDAQPIDISSADEVDDFWIIDTTQTDIALIELPEDQRGYPQISGIVDIEGGLGGVLVIAEPPGIEHELQDSPTGFNGVSGLDGSFTIFNTPPDEYEIRGYIADYQIEPEIVEVEDADIDDVVLLRSEEGIRDVNGQVQIIRGSGATSIILMVASTFDPTTVRGEVPAGLRAPRTGAPDISGAWTIEGVPAGEYVVLAGFENDELVRSPDEGIAGTDLVYLDVPGGDGDFEAGDSFKVTQALETISPGADGPEGLSERPTLQWGPISNADWYDVVVFDAFGDIVFDEFDIEHQGGTDVYEVEYIGPFDEGMYYQFRVISRRDASENSSTEFLRGVFYRE